MEKEETKKGSEDSEREKARGKLLHGILRGGEKNKSSAPSDVFVSVS